MKLINQKTIKWLQKKAFSLNSHLSRRFEYYHRVEHLNNCVLNSTESGISNTHHCNAEIIVSLTTYGKRLYEVYLTIESIMRQTIKPNRIILWLGNELINTEIPITLRNQQNRGLEIRYCKDIRSFKKLIPALKAFPSAAIITIDDDLLYYFDLVENLVNAYKKNPDLISCARIHRMKLLANNKLEKYEKWNMSYEKYDISPLNFPTGGAGALYPAHCFNEEVFNEEVFMDICQYADDVWFKAMALLNGVMSKKIFTHNKAGEDYLINENVQDIGLYLINGEQSMNDIQIKAVFDKYNLYERLLKI